MTAGEIATILSGYRFACIGEEQLGDAIAKTLTDAGVKFEREVLLDARSRIDFLCEGGVGIEVKIEGAINEVFRQLQRYACTSPIREIVLATTRAAHAAVLARQETIAGKPMRVARLAGGLF